MFGGFKMDRKINKLDNCHVEVIVNVEKEKWQQAQDKAFEKEAKKVKIDGFRAGKAPLAMVKKHVNQVVVLQNAADIVLQDEFNAILNTRDGAALKGCTLYVTLFPCNECSKAIIQKGIKEVVYLDNKYADTIGAQASLKMFQLAGTTLRQYKGRVLDDLLNK